MTAFLGADDGVELLAAFGSTADFDDPPEWGGIVVSDESCWFVDANREDAVNNRAWAT